MFADARSAMFGAAMTGHGQARDDLPYFGNVAFRMIRSVMPKFKMIQMGVHMVGTSTGIALAFYRADEQSTRAKART